MLPSRQGGTEVECDWFTDGCVFLHYLLMSFVKPKCTCAFWKKMWEALTLVRLFRCCLIFCPVAWVEWVSDQPPTYSMHVSTYASSICCWPSPHPLFPYSAGVSATAVRGTSGKLAFRRGKVLLSMSFHWCTEASWRGLTLDSNLLEAHVL